MTQKTEQRLASRTAMRVALRRAEHQVLDNPIVFDDPLSLRIIGPEAAADIRPGVLSRQQRLSPSFRAFMAARSRFAEDKLAEAVAAGVRQYVILGAGLDTFGYRNPHTAAGLRVFEVDHAATQEWKRGQLAAAGIEIPESTTLVPADFEHHTLAETLQPSGFRFDEPAFFSWLGVIPYLTERAFRQTLGFVASMPHRSGIVFDYSVPRESLNAVQKKAFDSLAARVARMGEPYQLFLDTTELRQTLSDFGFTHIEDLGHDELNKRYFAGRTDGFRVRGRLARLVRAMI
jgi:methyltransferase (TIGR00027 family)